MPNRIIRDGHLDSERVDALSEQAENFYSRLRLVVDDYGRFEADCVILLAKTFPRRVNCYTPQQIEVWLQECTQGDEPLVTIYNSGRKRYLQVNDFRQRQRTDSKYPAPLTTQTPSLTDKCQTAAGLTRASPPHTTPHTTTTRKSHASDFPESAAVIQDSFPGTDEAMVARITDAALEAKPDADDAAIAAALIRTRKKIQRSSGLWLETVPAYLRSARAIPQRAPVCGQCGGAGETMRKEFLTAPNSAWLDRPHGEVFEPCPECRDVLKIPPGSSQLKLVGSRKAGGQT